MNIGRAIFSQVMDYLPLHEFRKCVKRYPDKLWRVRIFDADNSKHLTFLTNNFLKAFSRMWISLNNLQVWLYKLF